MTQGVSHSLCCVYFLDGDVQVEWGYAVKRDGQIDRFMALGRRLILEAAGGFTQWA